MDSQLRFGRNVYGTQEMLDLLGCNRVTLRNAVIDGRIPKPVRFGLANFWDAESVDRHLESLFSSKAA